MRIRRTEQFLRMYDRAPAEIKKVFDQKVEFLLQNLRHPSLGAKKNDEAHNLWQARVTRGWRFYFTIEGDTYVLHSITAHLKR